MGNGTVRFEVKITSSDSSVGIINCQIALHLTLLYRRISGLECNFSFFTSYSKNKKRQNKVNCVDAKNTVKSETIVI